MKRSGSNYGKSAKEINTTNSGRSPRVKGYKKTSVGVKNVRDVGISSSSCNMLSSSGVSSSRKSDSEDCGTDQSEYSNTGTSSSSNMESSSSYSLSSNKKNSSGGIKFHPGLRLEAKDLGHDIWYAVKVVEVDQEEDEILIHFEKWSQRYDEWIPMDSSRLRPIQETQSGYAKKNAKMFKVGDNVMASWTDNRKYPAKIKTVLGNDKYEVLFFDGFIKNIKGGRMTALSDKEFAKIGQLKPGIRPSKTATTKTPPASSSSSSNNYPRNGGETVLGTKEERRERKRKLNVAELFHFKKRRSVDTTTVSVPTVSKHQQQQKLFSINQGRKKQSVGGMLQNKVGIASKLPTKKERYEVSVEKYATHSDLNDDQGEGKKNEGIIKANAGSTFKKSNKKNMGSQDSETNKCNLMVSKKSRKKFIKHEEERKSYQSVSALSRKDGGVELVKIKEEKEVQEQTLKPQEEWIPEGQPAYVVDGTGGPRKSIVVDDPRVPSGWSRHFIQRMSGHSAGKWDVFFVCPRGRKFRTRRELRAYYDDRGQEFPNDKFDFSLGRRKNKLHGREFDTSSTSYDLPGSAKSSSSLSHTSLSAVKGVSSHTPVRRVKTLLPRVRTSDGASAPLSSDNDTPDEQGNLSDNPVAFGDLKIERENDAYKCPKEGCCKFFRKESLLQMHMKHYHPEYNRFVASTPNVADLAYARTIGEPLEDMHPRTPRPPLVLKTPRFEAVRHLGTGSGASSPPQDLSCCTTPDVSLVSVNNTPDPSGARNQSNLGNFRNTSVRSFDVPTTEFNDSKQGSSNDLLNVGSPSIDVPKRTIRTLLPVTRTSLSEQTPVDVIGDTNEEIDVSEVSPSVQQSVSGMEPNLEQMELKGAKQLQKLSKVNKSHMKTRLARRGHKADIHVHSVTRNVKPSDSDESSQNTLVAGPSQQQPSVETLRKEDLVNCVCGYPEEDGLMIQCDLCLCWQHGICNNIELEDDVPEKYVCYICKHPPRERHSKHYLHDQDWLKEGRLPSLSLRSKNESDINQRTTILKRSNDLIGTILQLQQVIHSLRVKVNMVEKSDHPKLYLWNQSWEKVPLDCNPSDEPGSKSQSIMPRPSEVNKLDELKVFEQSDLNLNHLGDSQQLNLHQSNLSLSLCQNIGNNLTDCQSNVLEGDANDICSGAVNANLLTDDCDTKDICFAQDSMVLTKGENMQLNLLQTKINEENLPQLSANLLLENAANKESESESEKATASCFEEKEEETSVEIKNEPGLEKQTEEHPEMGMIDNAKDVPLNTELPNMELVKEEKGMDDGELQLPFCQKDLMHLATTMADKLESLDVAQETLPKVQIPQKAPQPEAPIVPQECRKTLLDHIEAFQQQIELRLTSLETQIAGLESMDPYLANDDSNDQETRESVQMLLRDLSVLNDVAALS